MPLGCGGIYDSLNAIRLSTEKKDTIAITRYQITIPISHLQFYVVCFLHLKYTRII